MSIKIINLRKEYKDVIAVNDINLEIKEGELFALLGVNGAGKTTLIKMLSTLTKPTSGDAFINGYSINKDEDKIKEIIDICPRTRRRVDAYFGLVSHTLSLCSVPLFTQCFFSFISIFHYKKNCGVDCLIFLHSLFSLQHGIKK